MYGLLPAVLLHPDHGTTTAASGGGLPIGSLAIGLFAALCLAAGLYLVLGAVKSGEAEADTSEDDPADESTDPG